MEGMPTRRNAREWLEAAMNGEVMLTTQQFAAAKVLIEYEQAKLVRRGPSGDDFGARLDRAIKMSREGPQKLIELQANGHRPEGSDE
jgi:hypothetical protein